MSTQFTAGPTRDVQAGDTPDLNDGLLSRPLAVQNIPRGTCCYIVSSTGLVTIGLQADSLLGSSPFVPIESVDNTGDGLEASGITAPQRVAVRIRLDTTDGTTIRPGDYLKVSEDVLGTLHKFNNGDVDASKYARYLGREAALLDRAVATPFDETLTAGIVPDQDITGVDGDIVVGWVQLKENEDL